MATEQTITPASGHAPFPNQGIADYDAIDFRRFWSRQYVEGVLSAGAYAVHEASTPGLFVTIDADVDPAFVQGDDVADQGIYYVAPHSAAITLDVPAPDVTNPRVDRVVLQVRDAAHDGSAANDARVMILPGTPTAGATLDNLSGAADLPDTALHLADYVAGVGVASILNANIRDFRTFGLRDARVGDLAWSAATSPGDGWVPADGRALRRDQHARLFAEVGTTWGAGDGSTTFNVPDFRGRAPIGIGQGSGLTNRLVGDKVGTETHTLTTAQIPKHDHPGLNQLRNVQSGTSYSVIASASSGEAVTTLVNLGPTDGGGSHPNMQPSLACPVYVFTGSVVG